MTKRLGEMDFTGVVAIGEGKKDDAPGLFRGMKLGCGLDKYDLAIDPVDGTTQTSIAGPEAMSVLAVADLDSMWQTEEYYILKFAANGKAARQASLSITASLKHLCGQVARAIEKPVDKLMVCILNRPRHQEYIDEMRKLGVRIKFIQDCDISAAIATCREGSGIDMLYGIGGAPEAVLTACAMKCLGGFFVAQVWRKDEGPVGEPLLLDDLVKGRCCFAATGLTNGSLLQGVRWTARGPVTNSVFMRSESGTIRWLVTEHGN
jgi:fructose-1,6-bisphosphatase II